MCLDQLFRLSRKTVLAVQVVAMLNDRAQKVGMVSDGKIFGISDIFLNDFIHSCVEPVMGGVVEVVWENLERHVVLIYTKSPEAPSLYRKRSSYDR